MPFPLLPMTRLLSFNHGVLFPLNSHQSSACAVGRSANSAPNPSALPAMALSAMVRFTFADTADLRVLRWLLISEVPLESTSLSFVECDAVRLSATTLPVAFTSFAPPAHLIHC